MATNPKEFIKQLLKCRGERESTIKDTSLAGECLTGLDLTGITFIRVSFYGARFYDVIMRNAEFIDCDFSGADIHDGDAAQAVFRECNLSSVEIVNLNLEKSAFIECVLRDSEMWNCNAANILLTECDIANFKISTGTFLRNASLGAGNTGTPRMLCPMACPEKGAFTGFKKAKDFLSGQGVIVELRIPATAKRSSSVGRKCRASSAKVIGFYDKTGAPYTPKGRVISTFDADFTYEIGKTVKPTRPFNENRWSECASGIHFFITFDEAVDYGT